MFIQLYNINYIKLNYILFFYLGFINYIVRFVMGLVDFIIVVFYILLGKLGIKSYVVNNDVRIYYMQ